MGNARRKDPRLARPRSGKHQNRSVNGLNGPSLFGIERRQIVHRRPGRRRRPGRNRHLLNRLPRRLTHHTDPIRHPTILEQMRNVCTTLVNRIPLVHGNYVPGARSPRDSLSRWTSGSRASSSAKSGIRSSGGTQKSSRVIGPSPPSGVSSTVRHTRSISASIATWKKWRVWRWANSSRS